MTITLMIDAKVVQLCRLICRKSSLNHYSNITITTMKLLLAVATCFCLTLVNSSLLDDKDFYNFYTTLTTFIHQPTDLVFVIDESGSVSPPNFLKELSFTEMVARMFRLAPVETRMAVITFSTGQRLRYNYLNNQESNICNFLTDLKNVDYKSGWTHTRVALLAAGNLFVSNRNAKKVIMLISDGHSNQGDPIPIAEDLRRKGIIIFCVGIGDFLRSELLQISSSESHLYLVSNFDVIEKFIADLRNDVINDLVVPVAKHHCTKTQCDAGTCICQRSGEYSCSCLVGHYLDRQMGGCKACAMGTYQPSLGQEGCENCPPNTNTSRTGSTSRNDCKCNEGFHGSVDRGGCMSIKCPKLINVAYGKILPQNCDNYVHSKCSFWCDDMYCPYDGRIPNCVQLSRKTTGERVCQPNGRWSGPEFRCDYVKCQKPVDPADGYYDCDSNDYRFRSRCRLKCNKGYTSVLGFLNCLKNGSWTGKWGHCEIIHCQPLKPILKVLMKPETCGGRNPLPYQTKCQLSCINGYKFVRQPNSVNVANVPVGHRVCTETRLWHGRGEKFTCADNTVPIIKCPSSIETVTKPSSKMSNNIFWDLPTATDNESKKVKVHPAPEHRLKGKKNPKSPSSFPIGVHKLVYLASDFANLSSSCSFTITVKDIEPPVVIFCPPTKEPKNKQLIKIPVFWVEPRFKDNSGELVKIIYESHKPNSEFAPGQPERISYKAADPSGNEASCTFYIQMKPYTCPYYRPPINGYVQCVNSGDDEICEIICTVGHVPVVAPKDFYLCKVDGNNGEWDGITDENPWPDCGAAAAASSTSANVQLQYRGNLCTNESAVQELIVKQLESVLQQSAENSTLKNLCSDGTKCKLKNVQLNCGSSQRQKRQATTDATWTLQFEIEVAGSVNVQGNETTDTNIILNTELSSMLEQLKLDNLTTTGMDEISLVAVEPPTVDLRIICSRGQQVVQNNCVNCPPGSFLNGVTMKCTLCAIETYQPQERSSSCLFCPIGTTTLLKGSTNEHDCLKPCKQGMYSNTGLEQCLACNVGFYQPQFKQTLCLPCPHGTTTWMEGSTQESDCQAPCIAGHFSPTGLGNPCSPCPPGSFQSLFQMTECIPCPGNLTTIEEGQTSEASCIDIDFCDPNPCNNGTCSADHEGNVDCICNEGYVGDYCDMGVDNCDDGFCFNNGTCVDKDEDYMCICAEGFTGERCETNINDCVDGVCLNGGTCIDGIDSYHCACPDDVAGEHCELVLKNCDSVPCQNGGTCFDTNKGFRCCCSADFTGRTCETEVNKCDSNPCMNSVSCINQHGNYTCLCENGYEGTDCEIDINDCISDLCTNGATCIDFVGTFKCECRPGFSGRLCETALSLNMDLVFSAPSDVNHVRIPYNVNLHSVTVSFWMQAWQSGQLRGTPVSFAYLSPLTKQPVTNALTWYDFSKFIIQLHDEQFQTPISGTSDRAWHHYALTWDSTDGSWAAYQDGEKKVDGSGVNVGQPLWKGLIVLGQDQDSIGGGFMALESFQGKLTQFNVWDFSMNASQVRNVAHSCGYYGNVFDWFRIHDFLKGEVEVQPTDLCSPGGARRWCQSECFCYETNKPETKDDLFCEHSISDCTLLPCQNNGECARVENYYICNCTAGTSGHYCQYDINECAFDNGNCSHNCSNTIGSYTCKCPDGFYLQPNGRTCSTEEHCMHDDRMYQDGEKWEESCTVCNCTKGRVSCHLKLCPVNLQCDQNSRLALVPGECCPRCLISGASCIVGLKNEYKTFDGAEFSFTSFCKYLLAQDCTIGTFSVSIENDSKNVKKKQLVINVYCSVIKIINNGRVNVNNRWVSLPYIEDDFTIVADDNVASTTRNAVGIPSSKFFQVSVTTKEELIIVWNSAHSVSIHVSSAHKKNLCGLCGNYNGFSLDDFQTRSYLPANSLTDFALSWRVQQNDSCSEPHYQNPLTPPKSDLRKKCPQIGSRNHSTLLDLCQPLRMHPFLSCYRNVDVREYYELCLMDACLCQSGNLCHCSAILTYISRCSKHRVIIADWKHRQMCENYCTGGQIFDECGPPCPTTCSRSEEQDQRCNFQGCRIGCRCPSSLVLHEGQCIESSQCP